MEENQDETPELAKPPMEESKTLGPNSALQLSLVVSIVGGIIAFTWFVRGLQADVRVMQTDVAGIKQSIQELNRIGSLSADFREMNEYGSKVSRQLAVKLEELRRDFEMHKAQNGGK